MFSIFGKDGGLTHGEVRAQLERERFSDYLPWATYDFERRCYTTIDNAFGYIYEIEPVTYADETVIETINGLLNIQYPKGTNLQFNLFADPYIGGFITDYMSVQTRQEHLVNENTRHSVEHLLEGQDGLDQLQGIPIRNFRCFVSVKSKKPLSEDLRSVTIEQLKRFNVRSVQPGGEDGLLATMRRFFSDMRVSKSGQYNENNLIRKQVLDAGAPIEFREKNIRFGNHYGRCITPQANPSEVSPHSINRLAGGMMGLVDDSEQITGPFIVSLNVIFDDPSMEVAAKSQVVTAQRAGGAVAQQIGKMVEEFHWAVDAAKNEKFVRVVPSVWVFGFSEQELRDNVARVKRLYESQHYAMQEESYLSKPLFIASLPLGLYLDKGNLGILDRDFIVPAKTAAVMAPIQGDYKGAGRPVLAYIGRKGQVCGFDLFNPLTNNYNFLVSAESGAGKSFLLNNLAYKYYASGSAVRIIDIGYSYEKNCKLLGGRFIDVGGERVVLNPFDVAAGDDKDRELSVQTAANVLALMATSAAGTVLNDTQINLLKGAAKWVFREGRTQNGIDAAFEYLMTFPKHASDMEREAEDVLKEDAKILGYNIQAFCKDGEYGQFFNGPSTLQIHNDDFVVLELEQLRNYKQLFSVLVMQVLNSVTQDLYLSDRERSRFILFEEAAAFLKDNMAGSMAKTFAGVIEAGFRRARKYRGSFGIVLQSVLDLDSFGDVGQVVWENAATKFLLQGQSYAKAAEKNVIPYDGFALDLLKSVRNNKPRYSEIFIDSTYGCGVGRLVVDPHSYFINTSDPADIAKFNKLVGRGLTPAEAIDVLVAGTEEQVLAKQIESPEMIAERVAAE